MELKKIFLVLIALGVFVLIVLALSNNFFLTLSIIFFIFAVYFYLEWKKFSTQPVPPYETFENRLRDAILQCDPRTLGYLMLRGSSDFQSVKLGKMVGVIEWNLAPYRERISKIEKNKNKKNNDEIHAEGISFPGNWDKVLIIGYKTKEGFFWNLPIVRNFVPIRLFACARHQLYDSPSLGDIRLKGVSIERVFCFDMLNSIDLDKDYIASAIHDEVQRITLEHFFNRLPLIIEEAVRSDGFHVKVKDLMTDKKRSGIVN
ncbi:MAG: hypothetical protein ABIM64_01710 [candidate division WOR-3 bacterium]